MKPLTPATPPHTHPATPNNKNPPKPQETKTPPPPPPPPSEFCFTITKVAVSQICQSTGFKGSTTSALHTLTHIATLYLQHFSKSASSFAALSGRTHSNLFDIVRALDHFASARGFPGASNPNRYTLHSAALSDLIDFVYSTDEIPFAQPLPRFLRQFHANSDDSIPSCSESCGLEPRPRPRHIPRWLTSFPDRSTCGVDDSAKGLGELVLSNNGCDLRANRRCKEGKRKGCEVELGVERQKVRFTIGVGGGLRNGVCGGGKGVCWDGGIDEGEDGRDETTRANVSTFKRG